jgi:hypothetical protein
LAAGANFSVRIGLPAVKQPIALIPFWEKPVVSNLRMGKTGSTYPRGNKI